MPENEWPSRIVWLSSWFCRTCTKVRLATRVFIVFCTIWWLKKPRLTLKSQGPLLYAGVTHVAANLQPFWRASGHGKSNSRCKLPIYGRETRPNGQDSRSCTAVPRLAILSTFAAEGILSFDRRLGIINSADSSDLSCIMETGSI
jgi:hypothetical protein